MLAKRVISGLALSLLLWAAVFLFPWPLVALVIALLTGSALWEFYRLAEFKGFQPFTGYGIALGIILAVISYLIISGSYAGEIDKAITIILFFIVITVLIKHAFKKQGSSIIADSSITILGVLYISFLFTFIIKLRYFPSKEEGTAWLMAFFIITKFSDISAYFCGTKWGRHKLIPRISAKKSIEGSLAGIGGAVLIGLLLWVWFLEGISWCAVVLLSVLLSVVGQVGDLIESLFKRDAEVKDSGCFVPGLGGVLDFMDSLLFTGPVMYLFLNLYLR